MTAKLVVPEANHVWVENVNMPFWAMVNLFVKAYFAFIVASVVLAILGGIVFLLFTLVVGILAGR